VGLGILGMPPLSKALHYTYTNHYLNKDRTFDATTIDLWFFKMRQGYEMFGHFAEE
jgi:hypothetical protein